MNNSRFGQRVKDACRGTGLTPNAAAKMADINISNFHTALRGDGDRFPSPTDLAKLSPVIKVQVEELQALVDADRLGPDRLRHLLEAISAHDHEHYTQPGADYPPGYQRLEPAEVGSDFGAYVLNRLAMMGHDLEWLAKTVGLAAERIDAANRGRSPLETPQIEAIANALRVPDHELQVLSDRMSAGTPRPLAKSQNFAVLQIPVDAPDMPDTWEHEVLKKIGALDFGDLDPRRDSHFWYWPREERYEALTHFEALWTAAQERRQREGNGADQQT